ncbi:MAG TPA: hypothetical protein VFS20_21520 [Longimicrobium sp.]|nr:hypothetical protein [Longimicrobium sp.]
MSLSRTKCRRLGPLLGAAWGLVGAQASGQELPDIESLRPASTPAFVILGVSPNAVTRPNTPADLAFTAVSATNEFAEIPRNLAVEFSPYWLTNRRSLTWRDDVDRGSLSRSFWRSLAFSAASTQLGDEANPRTALAFGGRALLLSGRVSQESVNLLTARELELAAFSERVNEITRPVRTRLAAARTAEIRRLTEGMDPADPRRERIADSVTAAFAPVVEAAVQAVVADSSATLEASLNELEELVIVREGPLLEIAGGGAWGFEQDRWESGKLDRVGVWATYSCEKCRFMNNSPARITPMLLLRYLRDVEGDDTETMDAGGRVALSGTNFGFSVEGVRRAFLGDSDDEPLWRVVGSVEYEVSNDTWLLASFGRDSRSPEEGDLVARFGLKVNFISDRYRSPSLARR